MESTLVMFKETLFNAFHDWIVKHEKVIGDKWYNNLLKKEKEAWDSCTDAVKLIGTALWMFNMISQFGILAGVGPAQVNLQHIPEGIDEQSTKRVLMLCSSCLCLQGLPKEIAYQQIPEAKAPWRFSLYTYMQWVQSHGK
jgi:hypothetical protein